MAGGATRCIRVYTTWLRPMRASGGPTCRFTPSCSEYAVTAFTEWGFLRGGWLAVRRLARCHPWGGFGDDPVPDRGRPAGGTDRRTASLMTQPQRPRSTHVHL